MSSWISAAHPTSGENYGMLIVEIVRKLPSIPCTVEEVVMNDEMRDTFRQEIWEGTKVTMVRLAGSPVDAARLLYIEAMREGDAADDWFPAEVLRADPSTCMLAYGHRERRNGQKGRLKFRVVPLK